MPRKTMKRTLSPERKKSLRKLADLMNTQNVHSVAVTSHLLNCFDIVISPKEVEFLLKVGKKPRSYNQLLKFSGLSKEESAPFIDKVLKKGLITSVNIRETKEVYFLSAILVGWCEIYLADGEESDEKKEFAESFEKYFSSQGLLNFFPVRNYLNHKFKHKVKPITRVVIPQKISRTTLEVNKKIEMDPVNIYPSQNVF